MCRTVMNSRSVLRTTARTKTQSCFFSFHAKQQTVTMTGMQDIGTFHGPFLCVATTRVERKIPSYKSKCLFYDRLCRRNVCGLPYGKVSPVLVGTMIRIPVP